MAQYSIWNEKNTIPVLFNVELNWDSFTTRNSIKKNPAQEAVTHWGRVIGIMWRDVVVNA